MARAAFHFLRNVVILTSTVGAVGLFLIDSTAPGAHPVVGSDHHLVRSAFGLWGAARLAGDWGQSVSEKYSRDR